MAAYKKLNSDYTLDTPDVYLTGNLHVAGIYETTTVVDLQVEDRNIANEHKSRDIKMCECNC